MLLLERLEVEVRFLVFLFIHMGICEGVMCQKDSINLKVELIYGVDRYFQNGNQDVYLPSDIRLQRQIDSGLGHNFLTYTDIPQFHASVFVGMLNKLTLSNGYNFNFDLFAEDRGQSFGSLSLDKIILFPRIYGAVLDTLKLNNQVIVVSFKAGDLMRYQHNYGLTINNLDVQGASLRLKVDQFYFDYLLIADLSQHVGLNVREFYSYGLGYQVKWPNWSFDLGISYDQYFLFNTSRNNFTISSDVKKSNICIYYESSYNIEKQSFAGLFGYYHNEKIGRLSFQGDISYRFYGKFFNENFLETSVRYRDISKPTLTNNSVGDYLYPLINSYRSFDQWSVYTEYSKDQLHATKLALDTEFIIFSEKFSCFINYEGLLIKPSVGETAHYNFFELGICL
jgi:hypothetical protein